MTEAEWLEATYLGRMLVFIGDRGSGRKLRLFRCACCRRIWHRLQDGRSRQAVEAAEKYADGILGKGDLQTAWQAAVAAASGASLAATAAKA